MIRRLPLIPTLLVLVAVGIMVRLGFWQIDRLHQKEALLARYAAAGAMSADVPFPQSAAAAESVLYRHTRVTCAEVTDATWSDQDRCWTVTVRAEGGTEEELVVDAVISAVGQLNRPNLPTSIPGFGSFEGPAFHSARWDHGVDLAGKRVAVIGTGASAVQFVPEIAPQAEHLYVFQRSAAWVLPKLDRPVGRVEQGLRRFLPGFAALHRALTYWRYEVRVLAMKPSSSLLDKVEAVGLRHLQRQIADPGLRARLTPRFRIGCKRILLSNDWYPALARDNVELVDSPITEVRTGSIVDAEGIERPARTSSRTRS